MVTIDWTELAIEDLHSIYNYVAKDSKVYAERLIEKIVNRVDQLINFPKSGRVVPEFNNDLLRELIQGNYRIVYKITSSKVTILRIHHAAKLLS